MYLGFHESTNLIYEGHSTSVGIAPIPQPQCSQIGFGNTLEEARAELYGTRSNDFKFLFREDSFDYVTRLRRGRIYQTTPQRPLDWSLIPHEAQLHRKAQLNEHGQLQMQRLFTYQSFSLLNAFQDRKVIQNLAVLIGTKDLFSKWVVVGIEPSFNGQEIVTLRSQVSNDVIPDIDLEKIRTDDRVAVKEKFEKFLDVVYSSSVESIIDRSCEACLAILLAKLRESNPGVKGLSLDKALEAMQKDEILSKRRILWTSAELLKLLHSRGKQSFQEQHNTRSLNYHDAQAAVECLSIIIYELDLS